MYKAGKGGKTVNAETRKEGIDILNRSLEENNSIIVGVDYTSKQKVNKKTDNTTDHFVTIVGRGNDKNGAFFTFYENATSRRKTGTDIKTNKLYLQKNGTLKGKTSWSKNATFTVTQIRPTKKKD